jgi:hypothetical protein
VLIQATLTKHITALHDGSAGLPFAAAMRALEQATSTLNRLSRTQWKILGLDKENEDLDKPLPELPITFMTPEEEAQIRAEKPPSMPPRAEGMVTTRRM